MKTTLLLMGMMLLVLTGCKDENATGPVAIKYDREICQYCKMIISDPRFAAEIRLAKGDEVFKFDDMGGAVLWLETRKTSETPQTEIWVRDMKTGTKWLDAKKVYYIGKQHSPMDYGFGAVETKEDGAVDFAEMRKQVIAHGSNSHCETPPATGERPSANANDKKG